MIDKTVHYCPEGCPVKRGINIEENSESSILRLIIRTTNRQIYFRIRQPYIGGNKYICEVTEL